VAVDGITPDGGTTTLVLRVGANEGIVRTATIEIADRWFLLTRVAEP